MKHLLLYPLVVVFMVALAAVLVAGGSNRVYTDAAYAAPLADGVNVRLAPGAVMTKGLDARPIFGSWYHVPSLDVAKVASSLGAAAEVVEPNYIATADSYLEAPLLDQVNAPAAWNKATGQGVTIAVIDTGVLCSHSALTGHCSGDADDNGHGTHVAGLAFGIAPGATIRAYKALNANGSGTLDAIAGAVTKAADEGARVENMSLGCVNCPSQLMADAITYANKHNVVVVSAAGNHGSNAPSTPGIYSNLVVAAVDGSDQLAGFSAWGDWVNVAAPGVNLLSTCKDGGYCRMSGTSMATPVTSGVAALVASAYPSDAPAAIANRVLNGDTISTAHPVGKRVNAAKALALTPAPIPTATPVSQPPSSWNRQLFDLLNQQRVANGLQALPWSDALARASQTHNAAMNTCLANGGSSDSCLQHQLPGEPDPVTRMHNAGWPGSGSENIGYGYQSPQAMVNGWMNSAGHRANILNPQATAFGPDFLDGSGTGAWQGLFWTLDVGIGYTPPSNPPPTPIPPGFATITPTPAPWGAGYHMVIIADPGNKPLWDDLYYRYCSPPRPGVRCTWPPFGRSIIP